MKEVKIIRYDYSIQATLGLLFVDGDFVCDTLELPWKDNKHDISCIETGNYTIEYSERHSISPAFEVLSPKDRDGILIHIGNTTRDTSGCILVGKKSLDCTVSFSRETFNLLLDKVGSEKNNLIIKNIS